MLNLFGSIFKPTSGWIKRVREDGAPGSATVLSLPSEVAALTGGVGSYRGRDLWIDVPVRVESSAGPAYEAGMKCQISQALGGMLEAGMRVNIRYDSDHPERVVLVDDVAKLLSYRIKG